MTEEKKNLWNAEEISPEFFKEQVMAMLTGCGLDNVELSDHREYEYNLDLIINTISENKELLAQAAKDISLVTVYGELTLETITKDEMGKFNLTDDYFTAPSDDSGRRRIAFTSEEIVGVGVTTEEGDRVYANTSLKNPEFNNMVEYNRGKDTNRTYRFYEENEKAAFDITFYIDEGNNSKFYIEETGGEPVASGTGFTGKDIHFDISQAIDVAEKTGSVMGGNKSFIVFDDHEKERTQRLVEKAESLVLPIVLDIHMVSHFETGDVEKVFEFSAADTPTAKCIEKGIREELEQMKSADDVKREVNITVSDREDIARQANQEVKDSLDNGKAESEIIEKFRARTDRLFQKIDNQSASEIEEKVLDHVKKVLVDYNEQAVAVDAVLAGSRSRGFENETSDVDVIVEIHGENLREDALFDMLHEDWLMVGNVKIDINPIIPEKTGTLEEYLPRVEEYFVEKYNGYKPIQLLGDELKQLKYSNFKIQKYVGDERYHLIADVKFPYSGNVKHDVVIGEFKNREDVIAYCDRKGMEYEDTTNYLQNRIENKKKTINEKTEEKQQPPGKENGIDAGK